MAADVARRAGGLLERDGELDAISVLLGAARAGHGSVNVIEGQAGVGKTELLRAAGELAGAAGMRVLRGKGSELDRDFAFGVVRQLLERMVVDDPGLLTSGAEPAAPVFAGSSTEPHTTAGLFASLQGLYWLLANLAAREPLVLLADDLHWADAESLRWLVFLAERVEEVPMTLVAATRPAEPGADQELLDALMTTPVATVSRPEPLSAGATDSVVRSRLPAAVDSFSAACHRATGGNPFLLGELLGELVAEGVSGGAEEAEQVLEFGSERVGLAVRRRLRLLPDHATAVARAVAVLGPGTPLDEAAALIELDGEAAARAADALAGIHVITAEPALDFVHPVVRSAVYDQIAPLERQTLHAQAAELLTASGAESERVARHLLRLPPGAKPARIAVLRAAAHEASARGASAAAARYLSRALDEPPADGDRGAVLRELGLSEATDRQRDRFDGHLRAAMASTPDPFTQAQIALELGRALGGCGEYRTAMEVFSAALDHLDETDGELGIAIEAELLTLGWVDLTSPDLVAPHWDRRFRQLDAGEALNPATLACLALAIASSRPPARPAIELADRVQQANRLDALNSLLAGPVASALTYAGAPSRAGRLYDVTIATAARRGSRLTTAWQLTMRSDVSLRLGETRRAEAEARSGLEFIEEGSGDAGTAWGVAHLMNALVARGALDEADELLTESAGLNPPPSLPLALLLTARADLHLAQGRPRAALSDAHAAGDLVSARISNPACCGWRSSAALALASLGNDDEAREMAAAELADARLFGVRDAEGASLRTLGVVTGGAAGIEHLRDSVAALERAESRLEHARSLLELGAAVRRTGARPEARELLREALDATERAGASGLADRAHEELVAAGARPRRDRRFLKGRESLTAGEDRVAELAAEGLTNREIAQRLFVTGKAVQWHLRNVYRKLEVGSREELPEAMARGSQDETLGGVG